MIQSLLTNLFRQCTYDHIVDESQVATKQGMSKFSAADKAARRKRCPPPRKSRHRAHCTPGHGETRCIRAVEVEQAKNEPRKTTSRDRLAHERRRTARNEQRESLQLREQQAGRPDQEAKQKVLETEFRARAILDEQRFAIVDQANFEFNLREAKSQNQ